MGYTGRSVAHGALAAALFAVAALPGNTWAIVACDVLFGLMNAACCYGFARAARGAT